MKKVSFFDVREKQIKSGKSMLTSILKIILKVLVKIEKVIGELKIKLIEEKKG